MKIKNRIWPNWSILAVATTAIIIVAAGGYFFFAQENAPTGVDPARQVSQPETARSSPEVDETGARGATPWLLGAIIFLSLATAVSVSISFYLYKWRRILLAQPNALVPEEWAKYLEKVGKSVNSIANVVDQGMGLVVHETRTNSEQGSKLVETFLTLQKAIDERDEEVKRLKRGYDAELFRRFLTRFIRVDQLARDYLDGGDSDDDRLSQVQRLLEDALDECGVEIFEPPIGEDSRSLAGIADNPKTTATDDEKSDFRIVEVVEPGYRLIGTEHDQVIIPAKVHIAVYEKQG